jgi:DHA2 family methylenomycin A resistance protein-like MFS transporter
MVVEPPNQGRFDALHHQPAAAAAAPAASRPQAGVPSSRRLRSDASMRRPAVALTASSLAFSLVLLDTTVVNVALPAIRDDLHAGVTSLQWIVNGYTLVLASLLLTAGALSDRLGSRRLMLGGVAVFAVASAGAALAPSVSTLVAAQVVLGLGAATLIPASLALLTHAYPEPARRARAVGIWASTSAAAFAAGPVVAGLLIDVVSWRAMFAINLPFAVAVAVLVLTVEETPRRASRGLDVPGQVTAVLALASLTFALIESRSLGWGSPAVVGALAVSIAAGLTFVAVEHRSATPMLPLSLFRSPTFSASAAAGALVSFAVYAQLFFLSLYLQEVRGLSALETGFSFLPQPVVFALAGLPAGRLVARIGPRLPLAAGGAIAAAGSLVLLTTGADTPYGLMVVGLVLFGAGAGTAIPALTSAVVSTVPAAQVGVASAALNASRQMGGVLGVAVLGGLVTGGRFLEGMHVALAVCAAALIAVALLGARHVEGRLRLAAA